MSDVAMPEKITNLAPNGYDGSTWARKSPGRDRPGRPRRKYAQRAEVLRNYPELAPELKSFFENRRQFELVARPLRAPSETARPGTRYKRIQYLGDYELLDEIGCGGMGVIFKAKQTSLQRIDRENGAGRSASDGGRSPTVPHRGGSRGRPRTSEILPIYEVGEHEGRQYFSMKFVEGGSLSQQLANGPIPVRVATSVMIAVAQAIRFAQRGKILTGT